MFFTVYSTPNVQIDECSNFRKPNNELNTRLVGVIDDEIVAFIFKKDDKGNVLNIKVHSLILLEIKYYFIYLIRNL